MLLDGFIQTIYQSSTIEGDEFMRYALVIFLFLVVSLTACNSRSNDMQEKEAPPQPAVLTFVEYKLDNMGRTRSEYSSQEDGKIAVDPGFERNKLQLGDVIYFETPPFSGIPTNPNLQLGAYRISRILARPGDTIEIKKGTIYVNDKAIEAFYGKANKYGFTEEEYTLHQQKKEAHFVMSESDRDLFQTPMKKTKIPNDHYFVMDDNWWRGVDSRHFGPLAADRIKGKVVGVTEDYRHVLNHLPEDA